ncbi:MAG: hypothetical protein K9W46_04815 [Candidatus Heimdallarchaeum endolithica]|uniref:Uncharacterized protein n=1 Tax=Candidatus Heimdallarchaeum endolithica TaxID=2876572 RepID=A0A9Y1FP70_9ARCH|nr:MAG: hypothetical protein K9W46_04815 [Candidatus Heimdallarchaeum endolithica]
MKECLINESSFRNLKDVQKLIFINVEIYVGIITYFQILDPQKVREFIIINEPFLKKLVKRKREKVREGERE